MLLFITITFYTNVRHFIYLNKFNIIILQNMYSASEWIRLDLGRFINVLLFIIILFCNISGSVWPMCNCAAASATVATNKNNKCVVVSWTEPTLWDNFMVFVRTVHL